MSTHAHASKVKQGHSEAKQLAGCLGGHDAQRNKLTGDRRAGESPPAGVRLSDGLGVSPRIRTALNSARSMRFGCTKVCRRLENSWQLASQGPQQSCYDGDYHGKQNE